MVKRINGSEVNASVADRPGQIPKEHIPLTMNSLLCERLYGFQRELHPDGSFSWQAVKDDGTVINDLMQIVDDPTTAIGFLDRICAHQKWGYQIMRDVEAPMVQVSLFLVDDKGEPQLITQCTGNPLGLTISLVIAGALKLDPKAQHRILYPGHYLQLSG